MMNTLDTNHFWLNNDPPAIRDKVLKQYYGLSEDKHCDVCVIGGGMTGAMCALSAAEMGLSVVLISSAPIGYGDTGHITGCARFDGCRTLTELDRIMTVENSLKLYAMGYEAIEGLQNLCDRLDREYEKTGISSKFERRDLLLFTSVPTELALLEREYIAIRKKFPESSFITSKTAANAFEFHISGGILTADGSAVFNPYALTHLCLIKAEELGAEIFEHTEAVDIRTPKTEDGCVIIKSSTHRTIYADRLIFAAGSEGTQMLGGMAKKRIMFAVIASSSSTGGAWSGKCTLGTFGHNPINCSISSGGLTEACCVCQNRIRNRLLKKVDDAIKFDRLTDFIRNVHPKSDEVKIKCKYAYHFIAPPDGLPIIGKHQEFKNCIFAVPGLYRSAEMPIYSQIAAKAALQLLEKDATENQALFDPMRIF